MSRLVRGLKFVHFLLLMKPAPATPCSLLHRMPCKRARKTGGPHKACCAADTMARGGRLPCWEMALHAISLHYPSTCNRQGATLHHFSCTVTAVHSPPPPPLRCIKSFRGKGNEGGRVGDSWEMINLTLLAAHEQQTCCRFRNDSGTVGVHTWLIRLFKPKSLLRTALKRLLKT